jgi:hypothetical protein
VTGDQPALRHDAPAGLRSHGYPMVPAE